MGSAPSRARALTIVLGATVRSPLGLGIASSSWFTIVVIDQSRSTAIPRTSHTARSAGSRRCRMVAVPVVSKASSIHRGSRSFISVGKAAGVNAAVYSSDSVSVSLKLLKIDAG